MKDIKIIHQEKYKDTTRYERVAEGFYKALVSYDDNMVEVGHYVATFSFLLEEDLNEMADRQYPLEDLLDEFLAHVSEFVQNDPNNAVMILELCTQNWLDHMELLVKIEGRHVYNREVIKDGETYYELVME